MKKHLYAVLVALLSMGIAFSCKKSSTPVAKNYTASVKDKTWWGMLAYTGKPREYYSVHFNTDNSLTWSQLSGDTPGQWVLDDKSLTITFTGNSVQIKAGISDDDKLVNITDNTGSSEINSGQLVEKPNQPLDNTVWKGSYFNGGSQQPLQLAFSPLAVITANFGALPTQVQTYTRSASGAVIRFGSAMYPFFAVVTSGNELKGGTTSTDYPLQAFKQ